MKNKSNRYFPETFVYNEVLCQRGKSLRLSSLSICQSIAFFLLHFLLYFNRGGKNICQGMSRILNAPLLYPFISWFTVIKMWKLTWYWEVTDSSLTEIHQMRHKPLLHSLLLWLWSDITNGMCPLLPTSKIKNDKYWKWLGFIF